MSIFDDDDNNKPLTMSREDVAAMAALYHTYGPGALVQTVAALVEVDEQLAHANHNSALSSMLFDTYDSLELAIHGAASVGAPGPTHRLPS